MLNDTVSPNMNSGESLEKDVSLEGVRLPTSVRKQLRKSRETLKRKKEPQSSQGKVAPGGRGNVRRKKNKTIRKIGLNGVFTESSHPHSPSSSHPHLLKKIKTIPTPNPDHSHTSPTPTPTPATSIARRPPTTPSISKKGILKSSSGSGRATTRKKVRFQDESGAIMPTPFPIPKRLRFTQKRRVQDEPIKLSPKVPRERTLQIIDSDDEDAPEILGEDLNVEDVLEDVEEIPKEELQTRLRKRGVYVQSSTPPELLKSLNVITADVPEGGIQRTG